MPGRGVIKHGDEENRMRIMMVLLLWMSMHVGSICAAAFDHQAWDNLLKEHVVSLKGGEESQVDYAGFKHDHGQLKAYLGRLSEVTQPEFDQWQKNEQLAFLINSYNAWTVELILSAWPNLESIRDLGSLFSSPWRKSFIPLLGDTRSLDNIEHDLIRGSGRYNDPRIHFAVNCASVGCPALRGEAYRGEALDTQLESQTERFLADRSRNRPGHGKLEVSSIFKWYRGDFEKGWKGFSSLPEFLVAYRMALGLSGSDADRVRSGEITIEFLEYDWALNSKREHP